MRSVKAVFVEVLLRHINYIDHRDGTALYGRPAAMSECVRYMDFVMIAKKRNHLAPRTLARHRETV